MKQRLDLLLVERGLAPSRTQAQALIMAGQVSANGRRLDKAGLLVTSDTELHVRQLPRYVSRAGEKLASVAEVLKLDFAGRTVLDVGSSTGGFTDFALQHGAAHVICVDVGTGQLAQKLRLDSRVTVMEQTDIRKVKLGSAIEVEGRATGRASLLAPADAAVIDVSFISLVKILPAVSALVASGASIVAMAKPQFEAGRPVADRYRGIIPMGPVRDDVLSGLRDDIRRLGFEIMAEADSGLAGAEGNVERFMLLKPPDTTRANNQ